jgi:dTDP-4-amino-4,6-dideoxygalactose transaminase
VPDITDADVAAVTRVLRSGWLTTGDECRLLEAELADYLGSPHVLSVSSCTAALELAFAYLDLPPGSRVGVPTWTFVASAFPAVHHGCELVLLDSESATLNVAPEAVAAALDDGLAALVAVHFGGTPVSPEVHALCAERGVPVIEDGAHALGASADGVPLRGAGSVGIAFSFYATKNLTSGEGGALATDDPALAEFARAYRLHGLTKRAGVPWNPDVNNDIVGPGIKANLPDILAALARSQLARFDALQARRRELVVRYRTNLARVDDLGFVPQELAEGVADHLLVVALPGQANRRAVFDELAGADITTSLHFRPLHQHQWFQDHASVGPTGTGVADDLAERTLSLPLHPSLSDRDVDRVCEVLESTLR